jgi:hypothetical protein
MATVQLQSGETFTERVETVPGLLKELRKRKQKPDRVSIEGYFEIRTPGFYQLLVAGKGDARISVDEQAVLEMQKSKERRELFLPLSLGVGWHKLQLDLEQPSGGAIPRIFLAGAEVTKVLSGENLSHE